MVSDARRHAKYIPLGAAYVVTRPYFSRVARIIEIDLDQVTFEYLAIGGRKEDWSVLDIFLSKPGFYVRGITCRKVSDRMVRPKGERLPHRYQLRRAVASFLNLSREQREKLEFFLANHAIRTEEGVPALPVHDKVPTDSLSPEGRQKEKPADTAKAANDE